MATIKLIGTDTVYTKNSAANYIEVNKYTADFTGTITEIHIRSAVSGNIKVGIYANSSGAPGALIGANNIGTAGTAGQWNIISLPATPVVSGTIYWLAIITDITGAHVQSINPNIPLGDIKVKSSAYSSGLPDPAGTGYTNSDVALSLAGYGIILLKPPSISQSINYGSPKLILTVKPSILVQMLAYGTPTVLTNELIVQPSSIFQLISIGTPTLKYLQILSPPSIIVTIAYGMPSVRTYGIITPQSIVQQISIGSPKVIKYVWHVILDGQYAIETPEVNRIYIIGRDRYGNPVWGEARDSAEIGLVGERLDFQQELAIYATANAAEIASSVLVKMRLSETRGIIRIPPNCGQELFDVVQVTDSQANQLGGKFRVVGLRLEYHPRQAVYQHELILAMI